MNRRQLLLSSFSLAAFSAARPVTAASAPGWDDLKGIEIDEIITETSYRVEKRFPDRLVSGVNGIVLTGFAAPLTPGDVVTELVLASDLGACPYCSEMGHSATALVKLAEPITGLEPNARVTLIGDFKPNFDPETWEAAIVENAKILVHTAPEPMPFAPLGEGNLDLLPPKT